MKNFSAFKCRRLLKGTFFLTVWKAHFFNFFFLDHVERVYSISWGPFDHEKQMPYEYLGQIFLFCFFGFWLKNAKNPCKGKFHLLSSSIDGSLYIWNALTGNPIHMIDTNTSWLVTWTTKRKR